MRLVSPLLLGPALLACALLLAAAPAAAVPVCDDEDISVELEEPPEPEPAVVPCAIIESGALGPWCLDASGYLITQSGVVLCEVHLPAGDAFAAEGSDQLASRSLPASTGPLGAGVDGACTPPAGVAPPAPSWLELSPGSGPLLGPASFARPVPTPPA